MDKERIKYLLNIYRSGTCSPEQVEELYEQLQQMWNEPIDGKDEIDWEAMYQAILDRREATVVRRLNTRKIWWAAASVALLLGMGGAAWYWSHKPQPTVTQAVVVVRDAKPGTQGAVLTLSNGKRVILDSLKNGLVAQQGGANAILANGRLSYEENRNSEDAVGYNTMSTPRGREYQLTLPDGTQVWLNAASSIKYPVEFKGNERRVEVTGEAYFEVAQEKAKPFYVNFGKGEVKALGTHFNINAYDDEPAVKTTLLEGKIIVTSGGQQAVVDPGAQASLINATGKMTTTNVVDLEQVMAWKNGTFQFDRTGLQAAMRQLSRWYDVDVVYEGRVPDIKFWGEMKRDLNLSEVLAILTKMGVHFTLENKKLIVTP